MKLLYNNWNYFEFSEWKFNLFQHLLCCSCLKSKVQSYDVMKRRILDPKNSLPIYECNESCLCMEKKSKCPNRLVQFGDSYKISFDRNENNECLLFFCKYKIENCFNH